MLNREQRLAVHADGHCMVVAPPGSGKTRTILERTKRLLSEDRSTKIVLLSFTRATALELKEKVDAECGRDAIRVVSSTSHAMARKQLEAAGERIVMAKETQINALLWDAYLEVYGGMEEPPVVFEEAKGWMSRAKSLPNGPSIAPNGLMEFYKVYQGLLESRGQMDFDDLIVRAVKGFRDGSVPLIDADHLMVDEWQDSSPVQVEMALLHLRRVRSLTVVGDDDQAIYGFRGAGTSDVFAQFEAAAKPVSVTLATTYRCAPAVLLPAQRLISHNLQRIKKPTQSARSERGEVKVSSFENKSSEAAHIAETIRSRKGETWAVLARSNRGLDDLEGALKAAGVEYDRSGDMSIWDYPIASLLLSVCHALSTRTMVGIEDLLERVGVPSNDVHGWRRGAKPSDPGSLARYMAWRGPSSDRGRELQELVCDWRRQLDNQDDDSALKALKKQVEKAKLYPKPPTKKRKEMDLRLLETCVEWLCRCRTTSGDKVQVTLRKTTFGQRVQEAMRSSARKSQEKEPPKVSLMTLHGSKGLEFDAVWIRGCEKGVIPSDKAQDGEEERRLMYVGMTRAKTGLYLSAVTKGDTEMLSAYLVESGLVAERR